MGIPHIDAAEATTFAEALMEQLISVHSSSATFRQIFKSQTTTQYFLDAYRALTVALSMAAEIEPAAIRLLEKLTHFGLSVALDTAVAAQQKQEVSLDQACNCVEVLTQFYHDVVSRCPAHC